MCVAENDVLTVKDIAIEGYAAAREPKKLVILPGGHFDVYVGTGFERTVADQVEFLSRHLLRR